MAENPPLTYLIVLAIITLLVVGSLFLIVPKKEVVNRFKSTCDIPTIGQKEVSVIVSGNGLPGGVVSPTGITLKVYNYSVPCTCESKIPLIK